MERGPVWQCDVDIAEIVFRRGTVKYLWNIRQTDRMRIIDVLGHQNGQV